MRTIYVSPDFPLNRRMRKDIRRGKLQVVREGGEKLSLDGEVLTERGKFSLPGFFGKLRQECWSAGIPDIFPVALFPINANRGEVELRAHKRLAGCRIAGEWFECSPDDAVRAVLDSL